jgi:hypothetical protein
MRGKVPENLTIVPMEGYRPRFRAGDVAYPDLDAAFFALILKVFPPLPLRSYQLSTKQSVGLPKAPHTGNFYPHGYDPPLVQMSEGSREAVSQLWKQIQACLTQAFHVGVTHGENFLARAASGEITITEIEHGSVEEKDDA